MLTPQLDLQFTYDPLGRTFLSRRFVTYPFFLARPFFLDSTLPGMLTVIPQSISGGIYEREQLALSLSAGPGAQVQFMTQSATVVHAMAENTEARQIVSLSASADAWLEYLPDPLILFPHANLNAAIHITAEEKATIILSDAFLMHDPHRRGRAFHRLCSETSVRRPDGRLVSLDRFTFSGQDYLQGSPGVMQSYTAQGTVWAITAHGATLVEPLRAALTGISGLYAGVSTLPHNAGVWARLLASDGAALQKGIHAAWVALRRTRVGKEPPRQRKVGVF